MTTESQDDGQPARPALREVATDALRYWERRRLVYNAALLLIVVCCFVLDLPESHAHVGLNLLLVFFVLAVIANVLYCLAYVVDVFVQLSALRRAWLRWRWVLFLVGTSTAAVIARFFSMGAFVTWRGN
jgi:hypothetical protein